MRDNVRWLIYITLAIVMAGFAIIFLIYSLGYMERAMVGSSLLSALIGFTLLSGSLYALKISAYIYSLMKSKEGESRET
ncbi:MAG: hypothetical protein QXI22_00215 [Sulfolobales archaeon]|jgi:uncharacterized membrane protein YgdD (TMEM256/DUF423 family)|nr:MAG: hypothetical protein DJ555_06620 [Desulfurococcaceae archaeon]